MLTLSGTLTCACPGLCILVLLEMNSKVAPICCETFCRACSRWPCFTSFSPLGLFCSCCQWVLSEDWWPWALSCVKGQQLLWADKVSCFSVKRLLSEHFLRVFFSPATLSAFSNHKKLLMTELRAETPLHSWQEKPEDCTEWALAEWSAAWPDRNQLYHSHYIYIHICFCLMNVLCHIISYMFVEPK